MEMQVMSKCYGRKTLEGLQKLRMGCRKKCEMARGRCRRRDLVLRWLFLLFVPLWSMWFIVISDMEIHEIHVQNK